MPIKVKTYFIAIVLLISLMQSGCTQAKPGDYSIPVITSITSDVPRPKEGDKAPVIYWVGSDNVSHNLSEFRGKPIIINTWNVNCRECGPEFPYFQEIVNKYSPQGLVFLSINTLDGTSSTREYLSSKKCNFTVMLDWHRLVYKSFAVPFNADPYTFFIDANGVLKSIQIGPFKSTLEIEDRMKQQGLIK
jgi:peroxiredoxin